MKWKFIKKKKKTTLQILIKDMGFLVNIKTNKK